VDGRADRCFLLTCLLIAGVVIDGALAFAQAGVPQCFIIAQQTNGMFKVTAIVRSQSAVSGSFRLVATKRNDGGTSQTVQQGQFDLTQGGEQEISATAFEAAAEGHVTVGLRLKTDRGDVSCSFPK
jgi:hypothetical protein